MSDLDSLLVLDLAWGMHSEVVILWSSDSMELPEWIE